MNKTRIKYDDVNECYYKVYTKHFKIHIMFAGYHSDLNELDEEVEEYNRYNIEEEEEEEELINADKIFKLDDCIICLTNLPNILFCNCGHIPICGKCEEMKLLNICPVCKTSNSVK